MIKIKDLTFSYTGEKPYLIESINMNIPEGKFISIIGENGSAKSTFVKLILGLLKPINGEINLSSQKIGYVPQQMESFNKQFPITVYEVYKIHLKALGIKNKNLIDEILEDISMTEYKHSLIGSLSGGQTQRVFIGRALLGKPEMLILDEPSTGMDSRSQNEIRTLLKELKNKGVSILTVEHNIAEAIHNSDYIIRMREGDGTICDIATFKDIIEHDEVDNLLVYSKEEI